MKLQKSLSNTGEKFAGWARTAPLDDLKEALTALNLIYQQRVTIKPLHPNQFKMLKPTLNDTKVQVYEGEADDEPIDDNRVYLMMIGCFIYKTRLDFSLYLQKVKREFRRPYLGSKCPCCGVTMTPPNINAPTMITIDHIIPVWVCEQLEYYHGIVDPKNMRVMCYECNSRRGGQLTTVADVRKDLGDKYVNKFFNKVNAYLPLTATHIK